jgi:hypothetical protein
MRTRLVQLLLLAPVVALAAAAAAPGAPGETGPRLPQFASCGELVAYVKGRALPLVGPYGLGGVAGVAVGAPVAPGAERDADEADFSSTNTQEQGVDEPDVVESSGRHLFVVNGEWLRVVDARSVRPRLVGSLRLGGGYGRELLLIGGRLLVLAHGPGVVPLPGAVRGVLPTVPQKTVLTEVDVAEPARPRVVRALEVDAGYVSARAVGRTVRVVVSAGLPYRLDFQPPAGTGSVALAEAAERNRELVRRSTVASWLPRVRVRDRRTGATAEHALVQCRGVRRPGAFSGLGLLTVLTIDLTRGLDPVDSDAILSDGRIVYASRSRLYVATERWSDRPLPGRPEVVPDGARTVLHAFDLARPDRTDYRGSGSVPGFLLGQWALSEHRGVLRVASTEAPPWLDPSRAPESESRVTTLEGRAGRLVELAHVGGLGKGERIHAVRFHGDVGYVVTFRQVDPLYTLDLADPRRPARRGELKVEGFSSYLHPLGDELLLGLGQDATPEGRVLGTQLSVFDVGDPQRPARLHRAPLGPGWSEAESDHHAFLYWAPARLVVVPLSTGQEPEPFTGAVAFRVGRPGIAELGRIAHGASSGRGSVPIRRSLVVGSTLFTVSDLGVRASALATLADRGWLPFPLPQG